MSSSILFEVEIRFHFDNDSDAYEALPFLHSCLRNEKTWVTAFYGHKLFKSGRVLRISDVFFGKEKSCFLSWKGPDIGEFANIRKELIEDITTGIVNSVILKQLGGREEIGTPHEVVQELERLGHHRLMSFQGKDYVGHYEPLGITAKLMDCPVLKWPLLVEIEKTSKTQEEATWCERELYELSRELQIQDRLVREEPPSLLYAATFAHEDRGS